MSFTLNNMLGDSSELVPGTVGMLIFTKRCTWAEPLYKPKHTLQIRSSWEIFKRPFTLSTCTNSSIKHFQLVLFWNSSLIVWKAGHKSGIITVPLTQSVLILMLSKLSEVNKFGGLSFQRTALTYAWNKDILVRKREKIKRFLHTSGLRSWSSRRMWTETECA